MVFAPLLVAAGIAVAAGRVYRRVQQQRISRRPVERPPQANDAQEKPVEPHRPSHAMATLEASKDQTLRDVLTVALTGTTAVIHLGLGSQLFVLNGVGFAGLLAAHYLVPDEERYKQYTRDALIGYTGFTIMGYFAVLGPAGAFANVTGIAAKLAEMGLIDVLWKDRQAASPEPITIDVKGGAVDMKGS